MPRDERADAQRFQERWRSLSERIAEPGGAADVGAALLAAHQETHRRYHGLAHVLFLLNEIDRRAPLIGDRALLEFAAFFHDAVYAPLAGDNEEQSAAWARRELARLGYAGAEAVAALILKTKSHHAGEASDDEALFLDMDFAILGAPRDTYAAYADAIREEYAAVPEDRFRAGRAAFLRGVLAQPRMFRTDLYERELAATARENLLWEIARLTAP